MKRKIIQHFRQIRFFLAIPLVAGMLGSCAKGDSNPGLAVLMAVHASPGLSPIDFYLNSNRVNGDSIISYTDTLSYRYVSAGTIGLTVKKNISSITYISKNIELEGGKYYSFFIIGKPDSVSSLLTEDDPALPASGKAKLRFLNLSPDSKPLDLKLSTGSTLFSGQAYKSYTEFSAIDAGEYTVGIYEQGSTVPLAQQNLKIQEGLSYSVWAKGLVSSADDETALSIQAISVK